MRIIWIMTATLVGLFMAVAAAPSPGPTDAAQIEQGRYLATNLGCISCHGDRLEGRKLFDDPEMATLWSSNLSRTVPNYDDAALAHVIRTGERPDKSKLWYMDAAPYAILSDQDMAALIAYLRSVPAVEEGRPRLKPGPRFAKAMADGQAVPESATLAADLASPAVDLGAATATGRYLARTRCGVCHKPDLSGYSEDGPGGPPDLNVATGYDREQFRALIREGKALNGRDLGEMTSESRKRFSAMRADEIDAIHAYLTARAASR